MAKFILLIAVAPITNW